MNYKRVTRLKRKYIVILTILLTLFSIKLINFVTLTIQERIDIIQKKVAKCDQAKGYTCNYYEIRNLK